MPDGQPTVGGFLADLLRSEIGPAMGCTEIGAAALAAAKAAEALGAVPETLRLTVSPNVYKNGVTAGIPGSRLKGLAHAAALGALIGQSKLGLNVLDGVTDAVAVEAEALVRNGRVSADFDPDAPDPVVPQGRGRRPRPQRRRNDPPAAFPDRRHPPRRCADGCRPGTDEMR